MRKIRVVLDTNTYISAFFWRGNPYKILKSCYRGKIHLLSSLEIIREIEYILSREKKFEMSDEDIEKHIQLILSHSQIVEPMKKIDVIKKDPSDNKFLECAIEGKTDYIISGNRHLLELKKFKEIKILRAKEFLDEIGD